VTFIDRLRNFAVEQRYHLSRLSKWQNFWDKPVELYVSVYVTILFKRIFKKHTNQTISLSLFHKQGNNLLLWHFCFAIAVLVDKNKYATIYTNVYRVGCVYSAFRPYGRIIILSQ